MRIVETINTIPDRIEKIRTKFCNGNNTTFAQMMGEKTNTTSGWISGKRGIGLNVISKILQKFPTVNPSWLLLNDGKMLKSGDESLISPISAGREALLQELLEKEQQKNAELLQTIGAMKEREAFHKKIIENVQSDSTKHKHTIKQDKKLSKPLPELLVHNRIVSKPIV